MRHVDLALRVDEIFFPIEFQLLDLELGGLQVQSDVQEVDRGLENRKRLATRGQAPDEFSIARVQCSVDRDLTRKISGLGSKETGEIAEVVNRSGDVAVKIRTQPIG